MNSLNRDRGALRGDRFNHRRGCGVGRSSIQCQVWSQFGHDALSCYYGYNPAYFQHSQRDFAYIQQGSYPFQQTYRPHQAYMVSGTQPASHQVQMMFRLQSIFHRPQTVFSFSAPSVDSISSEANSMAVITWTSAPSFSQV